MTGDCATKDSNKCLCTHVYIPHLFYFVQSTSAPFNTN